MEPNTDSTQRPARFAAPAAAINDLDSDDLQQLTDTAAADEVMELRPLVEQLEGQWLKRLAGVDGRGAAGAEQDRQFGSTAGWLRARLRMSSHAAATAVRTARALFRGPLTQTATALTAGELSASHAAVLASSTQQLPDHTAREAEPTLLDAARHLDPSQLRRVVANLQYSVDPDRADRAAQRRYERRGLWLTPTLDDMVAVGGQLDPEAGQTLLAALAPLARPADAHDERSGSQRNADALTELARRSLEGGQLPRTGGVRPQLSVIVDIHSLHGLPGGIGGDAGWAAPLPPEACRRLACDAAVTRVLVSRGASDLDHDLPGDPDLVPDDPIDTSASGLEELLRAAMTRLPPTLAGAPTTPLDLGRSTRVVSPAQRSALAVRDGGCVVAGCHRPLAWCEAHHVRHWLDGGPTDLDNLALLCRAHHRAIHDGGWRLIRGPDGRFTATPPYRKHRTLA